ncbi:MAG: type II secretion system protein GspM [Bacillota bacterium]|nr:type II secretion system protein GspM [Bacillota bacterium]
MSLNKREWTLLAVLGLLVYILITYFLVWSPTLPKISDKNKQVDAFTKQRNTIEDKLKNIENNKLVLSSKKLNADKLGNYLSESSNAADCVEYIQNLQLILGASLKSVNISPPVEKTVGQPLNTDINASSNSNNQNNTNTANTGKFYEFKISISGSFTYSEAMYLLKYVEGGNKLASVSTFKISPEQEGNTKNTNTQQTKNAETKTANNPDQKYQVDMELNLYSINIGNLKQMYEYSKYKFNNYQQGGTLFSGTAGNTSENSAGNLNGAQTNPAPGSTITIAESSYLVGGNNFNIIGTDTANDVFNSRTSKIQNVQIIFNDALYTIITTDSSGKLVSLSDVMPQKDISLNINADFPAIKDNAALGMNIRITNNSSRKISIGLNDKIKRVKITDRNGKNILTGSDTEKVTIG